MFRNNSPYSLLRNNGYHDSDVDRSCKDGQFVCRIFRGPTIPSCSLAHSSIHAVTFVTRSADKRGPIPTFQF